jgi:hypothetical protein
MGTQKQRDAFITAARKLGLHFPKGEPSNLFDSMKMEGTVGGYHIRVTTVSSQNNNRTLLDVAAPGLPEGLRVKRRTFTRGAAWARGGVKVGDPRWDSTMYVNGRDKTRTAAWLTSSRREVLLSSFDREWGPSVMLMKTNPPTLSKQRARVTIPTIPSNHTDIVVPVRRMVELLDDLELAAPIGPMTTRGARTPLAAPPTATLAGEMADPFITSSGPSGWTVFGWAMVAAIALLWILGYDGPDDVTWLAITSAVAALGLLVAVTRR